MRFAILFTFLFVGSITTLPNEAYEPTYSNWNQRNIGYREAPTLEPHPKVGLYAATNGYFGDVPFDLMQRQQPYYAQEYLSYDSFLPISDYMHYVPDGRTSELFNLNWPLQDNNFGFDPIGMVVNSALTPLHRPVFNVPELKVGEEQDRRSVDVRDRRPSTVQSNAWLPSRMKF
ncbi:uncharacterized protein LOC136039782 [Artemia franciscana]|uniref:Uncharacterized protein n=1 Tax=Artemia franciscana TaxID=6661 RepID=A0AA88HSV3_ARTSF|nr:hypothetical protein QYM36_008924 [Artemia franciscana]